MIIVDTLIESNEIGILSVKHLKRFWHKHHLIRKGIFQQQTLPDEWNKDLLLLASLGIGIEQTIKYLYAENPSFETFENWILALNNQNLNTSKIDAFNCYIDNLIIDSNTIVKEQDVLLEDDIKFWKENGYVIVRNAISQEDCNITIDAICNFINIDRYDNATWYNPHPAKQGIMVQLFQHRILEKNRNSTRIRKAYEQLRTLHANKIIENFSGIFRGNINFDVAKKLSDKIIEMFDEDKFDVCEVIYSKFKSAISQEQVCNQIIPAPINFNSNLANLESPINYEPSEEEILKELLPKNIAIQIYNQLLENSASEQGARMSAMESASNNAGKMIKNLTLVYNRTRQANITRELIDIVSGANAV